jgi:hypothetical protein
MLLIVAVIFGLTVLALLLTPYASNPRLYVLDTVLVSIAVMALVSVCTASSRYQVPTPRTEAFSASPTATQTPPPVNLNYQEIPQGPMSTNLSVYLTSYNSASYAAGSTTNAFWKNVAPATNQALVCTATGDVSASQFKFATAPPFSKIGGFDMRPMAGETNASYKLEGPPTSSLGLTSSAGFSVFALFHQEAIESTQEFTVFQLFANDVVNNNAIRLSAIRRINIAAVNSVDCIFKVELGNTTALESAPYVLTHGARYLLMLTLAYSEGKPVVRLMIQPVELQLLSDAVGTTTGSIPSAPTVLLNNTYDASVPTFQLSNRAFVLNPDNAWTVRLVALGMYKAPVTTLDALYEHYVQTLRLFYNDVDPGYQSLINDLIAQSNARYACTFTTAVCNNCPRIDWTNFQELLQASTTCKTGVAEFCLANPSNSNCSPCWDASNAARYGSAECRYYRCSVVPGRSECTAQLDDSNLASFRDRYCSASNSSSTFEQIVNALAQPDTLSKVETIADKVLRNRNSSSSVEGEHETCERPRRLKFCESTNEKERRGFFSWLVAGRR